VKGPKMRIRFFPIQISILADLNGMGSVGLFLMSNGMENPTHAKNCWHSAVVPQIESERLPLVSQTRKFGKPRWNWVEKVRTQTSWLSGFLSGCHLTAILRYARLISSSVASQSDPRCGPQSSKAQTQPHLLPPFLAREVASNCLLPPTAN